MALTLTVTDAGRAALVNAANTGTAPVTIAQVGLSGTAITPQVTATALPGEFKRLATLSGDVVADDTIHLIVRDESTDVFTVRSAALYLADGTLFAIYGQSDVLIEKSAQALMLLAIDVRFEDIDAAALTFGDANFLNPPATTEVKGVVELATLAESLAGIDTGRVPAAKMVKDVVFAWLDARFGANNAGIWHPANDGAGSGLDADLLDGVQASEFIRQNIGGRPISYNNNNGRLDIRGDVGGWATGLRYLGSSGIELGGFGAYGGGDTLSFLYAGPAYGALNALRIYADRPAWGANTIWHAANDGAGSGLDADLLDGFQASEFARLASGPTFAGDALTLTPATSIARYVLAGYGFGGARTISLNQGVIGVSNSGFSVRDETAGANRLEIDGTGTVNVPGSLTRAGNVVWHAGNDGSGSGLDADLLDGLESNRFVSGVNPTRTTNISDINSALPSGFYDGYNLPSAPNGDWWSYLHIRHNNESYNFAAQLAFNFYGNDFRFRTIDNNAPKAWARVWHDQNDGSGSGLDADLLDGVQASEFIRQDYGNRPVRYNNSGGALAIKGDAGGWVLGYTFEGSAGSALGGYGAYGGADGLNFLWAGPAYNALNALRIYSDRPAWGSNTIWHAGNDGAGSGLDADLLDGQQASYYTDIAARLGYTPLNAASYTAADVRAKLLTVDGSGSGLDADLLDGQQASYYTDIVARLGYTPLNAASYTAADVKAKLLTVDGAGSGIDADLLDGQQASYYTDIVARLGFTPLNAASYTAADVKAKLLTVDGAGSGLDADLLDGLHAAFFQKAFTVLVDTPSALVLAVEIVGAVWYVEMGTGFCSSNSSTTVTFPQSFANRCFFLAQGGTTNTSTEGECHNTSNTANTGNVTNSSTAGCNFTWIAIGR